MKLAKYDPMTLLDRMHNEISEFFQHNGTRHLPSIFSEKESWPGMEWSPSVDIKEEDKQYVITADIPGVDPKDIEVTMANGMLRIKGERTLEKEEKKKDYRLRECSYGSFERAFSMPDTADSENIKAKGKNGVLSITVGKKAGTSPRKITIES